jgi:hypothetical protein
MQISLPQAIMITPGRGGSRLAPGHIWLLLEVSLTNRKQPFAAFGEGDFFAVATNGQTFPAKARDPSRRVLGSGRLKNGASVRGWVGFVLPTLPTSGSVIWNDNNHLIPPEELLKYTIRAA